MERTAADALAMSLSTGAADTDTLAGRAGADIRVGAALARSRASMRC
jgi:hypothetical protein